MDEKKADRARERRLQNNYKLSIEDYDRISAYQKHVCYACNQPEPVKGRRLSVDHCHTTGLIRGLLCSRCNPILGKLERAFVRYGLHKVPKLTIPEFLFFLRAYIQTPPATSALQRSHFGYPGRVGTKAHRDRVRKENKKMTPSKPLIRG